MLCVRDGSWLRKNVSERSKATSDWLASTLRRADWLFLRLRGLETLLKLPEVILSDLETPRQPAAQARIAARHWVHSCQCAHIQTTQNRAGLRQIWKQRLAAVKLMLMIHVDILDQVIKYFVCVLPGTAREGWRVSVERSEGRSHDQITAIWEEFNR